MSNEQSSIYTWFAVLEGARNTGDFELAAKAKRELARLGVDVRYRRPAAAYKDHTKNTPQFERTQA
jgi:hypothetical protein